MPILDYIPETEMFKNTSVFITSPNNDTNLYM